MTRADPDRLPPPPARVVRRVIAGASWLVCAHTATAVVCPPGIPTLDDAPSPSTKFALAERDCGWQAPDDVARPTAAGPRVAEQLALYQTDGALASGGINATAAPAAQLAAPAARAMQRPTAQPAPSARRPMSGDHARRVRTVAPALARAARDYDIDPWLLHAVAHVESRHNPVAQSHAGARGLMQVMPATARRFGVQQPHQELLDFETNVRVSAEYLKVLQGRFGNNLPLVLAAYNAGEGAVEKYGRKIPPYRETQAYVRMVLDTYLQLRHTAQRTLASSGSGVAP